MQSDLKDDAVGEAKNDAIGTVAEEVKDDTVGETKEVAAEVAKNDATETAAEEVKDDAVGETKEVAAEVAKNDATATQTVEAKSQDVTTATGEGAKSLPPEPQVGNIEYKLKLANLSSQRFEHLVTQLKWRLTEGKGRAIYEIGVEDNGVLTGITGPELTDSLRNLEKMAARLGAKTEVLKSKRLRNGRRMAEVLVLKKSSSEKAIDIRVAIVGSVNTGKSTLITSLVENTLDNGKGSNRIFMTRYQHELFSGHTSSIAYDILPFDNEGKPIYAQNEEFEDRLDHAAKIITFFDLPGIYMYLHTALRGLSSYKLHYVMIAVSTSMDRLTMTIIFIRFLLDLRIPFFFVFTKTDLGCQVYTLKKFKRTLGRVGITLDLIEIYNEENLKNTVKRPKAIPIFFISNVTGSGIDLLLNYLSNLSQYLPAEEDKQVEQNPPVFRVVEKYLIEDNKQVVGGVLVKGRLTEGMKLHLGPHEDGSFTLVNVVSIQRYCLPCGALRAGQIGSICIDKNIEDLRRGMVLLSESEADSTFYFQAFTHVIYHSSSIRTGYEATIFAGNVRQLASVIAVFAHSLRTGNHESMLFRFKFRPECIKNGQGFIFIDGANQCVGTVTQIFPQYK